MKFKYFTDVGEKSKVTKRVTKRELKLEDYRECLENKKLIPRSQQKQEIF